MLRNILVPLDGSGFGEQALPVAVSLARRSGGKVHVLHIHQLLDHYYLDLQPVSETLEVSLRKHEQAYLDGVAKRLRDAGVANVSTAVDEGQPANAILAHAVKANMDLVLMTTHARGAFGRFWLGSTADELVRELPMPVLLIHPTDQPVDLHKDVTFKNILVPLDGTPLGEQILPAATSMAALYGAPLTLLRVVRPLLPTNVPVGMGSFSDVALHLAENAEKLQKQVEGEAHTYLTAIAERIRGDKVSVATRVAVADQPGVGVLQEARAVNADFIALETHGRRGLKRLFLGSVADKIVRGATVPVLVNRPKQV